jgi:hypothetical protein
MRYRIWFVIGLAAPLVLSGGGAAAQSGKRAPVRQTPQGNDEKQEGPGSEAGDEKGESGSVNFGGASTYREAECARGMGILCTGMGAQAAGLGKYNLYTAQAVAINTKTSIDLNEYLWQCQQVRDHQILLRRQHRHQLQGARLEEAVKRLREKPTPAELESGAALNAVYDQVTEPRSYRAILKAAAGIPLEDRTFRGIQFRYASGVVTISLQQLTARGGWPPALRGQAFEAERQAYQKALEAALAEDAPDKEIAPEAIQQVRDAVRKLVARMDVVLPPGSRGRPSAEKFLKSLAGMAQMLEGPEIRKIQAAIRPTANTKLSDLLTFMLLYNLHFGPAETPGQKLAYKGLFADLAGIRDQALKGGELRYRGLEDVGEIPVVALNRAMDAFQKIGWDRLLGAPGSAGGR